MTEPATSDWQRGGIRYAKLKEVVPEFLAPGSVHGFIVAVRQGGGRLRLFNPLSPLQREFVVAVTDQGVVVLWLRRPGVFRPSIGGIVYKASKQEAEVRWSDGKLVVAKVAYQPIAFHSDDAEALARIASAD